MLQQNFAQVEGVSLQAHLQGITKYSSIFLTCSLVNIDPDLVRVAVLVLIYFKEFSTILSLMTVC